MTTAVRISYSFLPVHEFVIFIYLSPIHRNRSYDIQISPNRIFANKEVNLDEIKVYGFDYDYTIASYKKKLQYLIFDMALDYLIEDNKYPKEMKSFAYDPGFGVRGLHYDIEKGLLMKIDSQHHVELGTVYRGYTPLDDSEVLATYGGTHLSVQYLSSIYDNGKYMRQLIDVDSLSEMALLTQIAEYFKQKSMSYDPKYIFMDVKAAIKKVHLSGKMHATVKNAIGDYLEPDPDLKELLEYLTSAKKKIFIITNSQFDFLNAGMTHLIGPDWRSMFDIIITSARKPSFYTDAFHHFRHLMTSDYTTSWDRVKCFKKGEVYQRGSAREFLNLAGFKGSEVLYFGDQVYRDLADLALKLGWKTGAVIPELEREIEIISSDHYQRALNWLISLEKLIDRAQSIRSPEALQLLHEWKEEYQEVRKLLKMSFNPRFGSMFRTSSKATYFSGRIARYADLYTSSITNFLTYQLHHTFYQKRSALPHEFI
ncbi:uncharacterized protein TRIADDRAFT_52235 [Trichoplax adhaerens]|uniref:5'-nucleotidase domain-containing protein 3 n=1 Tax=Trichoplax adhaerens TaxID=10228 RepID=B3RM48_TRIAD|nr:hypothetical protein TRIADDRAFT_52235 [Trichoplax adhaerens]EDV29635.1 hypothetical protein TRIADDRAFT_52235 [Trichoplax adhaerens]|eukprot:XP_002108837.1 hypothetical protein TRIADDRAFT_52235 [Trichoplax adhaerens]